MTKILLIGDCHGEFNKLDEILTKEEPFNFFISSGDVGVLDDVTFDNIKIIDKWKDKGTQILGNHDNVTFFNPLSLIQDICGVRIAALNGIIRNRIFIRDFFRDILFLSHQKDIDILVTHQTPTGIFNHMGEPTLEVLLHYTVPQVFISGHIHQYKTKFYGRTFVISLPLITEGYVAAYFDGKKLSNIEVVLKKGRKIIRI